MSRARGSCSPATSSAFPRDRLQVLGETEITYLASLDAETRREHVLETFFSFPIPCVFVTKGQELPPEMIEAARRRAACRSCARALKTNEFYTRIKPWLEDEFAPTTKLHGSLADVFGVGLLFVGQSGIGKSECVLDLVERGHRLVADDLVIARRRGNDVLIGRGHELQRHTWRFAASASSTFRRSSAFAPCASRSASRSWCSSRSGTSDAQSTAPGSTRETTTILDVELPKVTVPLNPGKNITVIAEVDRDEPSAQVQRHRSGRALQRAADRQMRAAASVRAYLAGRQ